MKFSQFSTIFKFLCFIVITYLSTISSAPSVNSVESKKNQSISSLYPLMKNLRIDRQTSAKIQRNPVCVLFPNGNEKFLINDSIQIRWRSDDSTLFNNALIRISPDNGKSWAVINSSIGIKLDNPQWGNYPWRIPEKLYITASSTINLESKDCLISVSQYANTPVSDKSDTSFRILRKPTFNYTLTDQKSTLPEIIIERNNQYFIFDNRVTSFSKIALYRIDGKRVYHSFAGYRDQILIKSNTLPAAYLLLRGTRENEIGVYPLLNSK